MHHDGPREGRVFAAFAPCHQLLDVNSFLILLTSGSGGREGFLA
jgi:hypothetical protein